MLCSHYHYVFFFFTTPKRNSVTIKLELIFPYFQSLVTSKLLSASMNWSIPRISCKWNRVVFILLCLASFS